MHEIAQAIHSLDTTVGTATFVYAVIQFIRLLFGR